MYLEILATHIMSPLLHSPFTLSEVLENIKKGMARHHHLVLPK